MQEGLWRLRIPLGDITVVHSNMQQQRAGGGSGAQDGLDETKKSPNEKNPEIELDWFILLQNNSKENKLLCHMHYLHGSMLHAQKAKGLKGVLAPCVQIESTSNYPDKRSLTNK